MIIYFIPLSTLTEIRKFLYDELSELRIVLCFAQIRGSTSRWHTWFPHFHYCIYLQYFRLISDRIVDVTQ